MNKDIIKEKLRDEFQEITDSKFVNNMGWKKEFEKECSEELGYISSIFMSQGDTKAKDIVMPTFKLKESADRFGLYLFKALAQQKKEILEKVEFSLGFSPQNSKPLKSYTIDKEEWKIMKDLIKQ